MVRSVPYVQYLEQFITPRGYLFGHSYNHEFEIFASIDDSMRFHDLIACTRGSYVVIITGDEMPICDYTLKNDIIVHLDGLG